MHIHVLVSFKRNTTRGRWQAENVSYRAKFPRGISMTSHHYHAIAICNVEARRAIARCTAGGHQVVHRQMAFIAENGKGRSEMVPPWLSTDVTAHNWCGARQSQNSGRKVEDRLAPPARNPRRRHLPLMSWSRRRTGARGSSLDAGSWKGKTRVADISRGRQYYSSEIAQTARGLPK